MKRDRREFLAGIGSGMFIASVGSTLAIDLGLAPAHAAEGVVALNFGELEPLVCLMQDTPVHSIQRKLVEQLNSGTSLQQLVIAGALANARTFGGQDYNGYHTFMALAPALEMSKQLPDAERPLPILKVLYRNTNRIQECGGRSSEVLQELHHASHPALPSGEEAGKRLQAATRTAEFDTAEQVFADIAAGPANEAFNHLQFAIQDEVDVHRIVLAWRAWKMTELAGESYAHTLLRQSVRYCVDTERSLHATKRNPSDIRKLLPILLNDLGLFGLKPGLRTASDAELADLSQVVFNGSREQAARAVADALKDGMSIESVGEALSLAANHLLLFDPGRTEEQASQDKPTGSVHGASVGVHACDSANAWRNIARVSNYRNQFASLIVGAYHTAGQRRESLSEELPYREHAQSLLGDSPSRLEQLDEAIRSGDQLTASALTYSYVSEGGKPSELMQKLLKFAVSEEGALHAEKFYRTIQEEHRTTRPTLNWRHLVALARVTASEYGFPAAGMSEARELLNLPG
ncbi:MAG: hypothetical protein R3C53_08990 [Pirellulaceae bacterium]